MMEKIERKRIWLFLVISFGLAWAAALAIYLTGGITASPPLLPGSQVTLAVVLMAGVIMMAPTVANILTRLITREGKESLYLRPGTRPKPALYWLAAWFVTALLILAGAALFFWLFPPYFDSDFTTIKTLLEQQAQAQGVPAPAVDPWFVVASSVVQALLLAPVLNALFTYGEEFGWRGYLLPKLLPLGNRRAVLLSGVIWGLWHAPLIAMGHNYGTDYLEYPWLGILMMIVFCVGFGTYLAWLTLKEGSIWPAVIAHAVMNALAGISGLVLAAKVDPVMGPMPVNLIGGTPFLLLTLFFLMIPEALSEARNKPRWQPIPIDAPEDGPNSQDS